MELSPMTKPTTKSFFDAHRLTLEGAIKQSIASLLEYGLRYRHWVIAYSGGKDSTATVTFVAWAIKNSIIPQPESLTILYADTRMELPPLQRSAMRLLAHLERDGFNTHVVLPEMDYRFYVYMFGRGVPPSSNTFRWCTPRLKIEPMARHLENMREANGEKFLMITGVRLGESEARDQRIALSCSSKNDGECGQGWFQVSPPKAVADTLAPLLHWRLCHVFDWLYFEQAKHGYDVSGVAKVYGESEVRTGCIGCPVASRDFALERVVKTMPQYKPLLKLKPLFRDLKKPKHRLRKPGLEKTKAGNYPKNQQRMGPLTFESRLEALEKVLAIQAQAGVDLINRDEYNRIHELVEAKTWPNGWDGNEPLATEPLDAVQAIGRRRNGKWESTGQVVTQALLI